MGTLFGAAYTQATQLGLRALNHLGTELGGVADAILKIGEAMEATDKAQAQTFTQAGGTPA